MPLEIMRNQVCLMPAKCVKCEELFDLSYDYRGKEESLAEKENKKNKLLCWECRLNERVRR